MKNEVLVESVKNRFSGHTAQSRIRRLTERVTVTPERPYRPFERSTDTLYSPNRLEPSSEPQFTLHHKADVQTSFWALSRRFEAILRDSKTRNHRITKTLATKNHKVPIGPKRSARGRLLTRFVTFSCHFLDLF